MSDLVTSSTALEFAARAARMAAEERKNRRLDLVDRYEAEQREWERKAKLWKKEEDEDARASRRRRS